MYGTNSGNVKLFFVDPTDDKETFLLGFLLNEYVEWKEAKISLTVSRWPPNDNRRIATAKLQELIIYSLYLQALVATVRNFQIKMVGTSGVDQEGYFAMDDFKFLSEHCQTSELWR